MSSVARNLGRLFGSRTSPTPGAQVYAPTSAALESVAFYGTAVDGGILLDDSADGTLLPDPVVTLGDYSLGDRVALTLQGHRPVVLGRVGGLAGSELIWGLEQGAENAEDQATKAQEGVAAHSEVLEQHRARIEDSEGLIEDLEEFNRDVVDPALVDLDHALTVELPDARDRADAAQSAAVAAQGTADQAALDAEGALHVANLAEQSAAGLIEVGPSAPGHAPGRVWMKTETITNPETNVTEDRLTGIYQSVDDQWRQYTMMTGLLIVPGEDGTPTIIDESGMVVGTIAADAITTEVLAADSVGAKQLIIGDISREFLDDEVDGVLGDAEAWAERVVIEPSGITISRGILGGGSLTGLRLEATKLDFIVDGQPVAYMDSELNQMGIKNAMIEEAIVVGEHQIRRLGQGNITLFQWVGE